MSGVIHPPLWYKVPHWTQDSRIRLGWLAIRSQRSACFCLPSAFYLRPGNQTQISMPSDRCFPNSAICPDSCMWFFGGWVVCLFIYRENPQWKSWSQCCWITAVFVRGQGKFPDRCSLVWVGCQGCRPPSLWNLVRFILSLDSSTYYVLQNACLQSLGRAASSFSTPSQVL